MPDTFGLLESQIALFNCWRRNPKSIQDNVPMHYRFPAGFDTDRLAEALKTILNNHPVFFSRFERRGEDPVQIIQRNIVPKVERLNLDPDQFRRCIEDFPKPFDLEKDPLYRAAVIRTPQETALLFDVHRIIADDFSLSLLMQELAEVWEGKEIPAEHYSFAQYAQDKALCAGGFERRAAEEFFREQLSAIDSICEIPPDCNVNPESGHLAEEIVPVNVKAVQTYCRKKEIAESSFFLAGTCFALSRFTAQRTVSLSVISSGRSDPRLQNTAGMFVRTLPFCAFFDPQIRSADYARSIHDLLQETLVQEEISLTDLAARYGYVPKIAFACELDAVCTTEIGGVIPESSSLRQEKPKFPLSVRIAKRRGRTEIIVQYNDALYLPFRMKMLAGSLAQALSAMMSFSENPIGSLSLITPDQKKELERFHCRAEVPISEGIIHRIFEKGVDAHPDQTALIACDGTWTFAQLDADSNRMAHALIGRGIRRGDRIAYLLPRTSRVIISMLGILKAGAAFIPCDPDSPRERIAQILADCGAKILITTSDLIAQYGILAADAEVLLAEGIPDRPKIEIHPEDLAYLIYTSGSIGKPKGIMLEHRGISNYVLPHPAIPHVFAIKNEAHALLSITAVSVDMSLCEILPALCNGVALVFAGKDHVQQPDKLAQLFAATGADAFSAAPSLIRQFLADPAFRDAIANCQMIIAGGEMFPETLLQELRTITRARIFNIYGPTEITVSSNCKELSWEDEKPVIGRPLLNYWEFIVDSEGNELPPCAAGELLIGGPCIARGYVNLPEETASAFINFHGFRVYRSGDRAEWLENGEVDLLGRMEYYAAE
ncbi:MAG: AMP-binding protein [Planctomycetia bacterium]|nr:AMP-binding protein [Planctomycetia bacterium]